MYGSHTARMAHEVESMESKRKMENIQKRKLVESENKHMFSDVIDSKVRGQYMSMAPGYNLDFGYEKQEARIRQVNQ